MIKQNRLIGAALQSVCLAFEQVATLVAYSFLYSHHVPPKNVDRRFFTRVLSLSFKLLYIPIPSRESVSDSRRTPN